MTVFLSKYFLKSLFTKRYGFPQFKKKVWYNFRVYDKSQFPIIFNEKEGYIPCEIGNIVQMGVTNCGKKVFYKITNTKR